MQKKEMIDLMITELERWQMMDAKFGGGFKACMKSILDVQVEAGMLAPYNFENSEAFKENCHTSARLYFKWDREIKNEKK